MKGYWCNKNKRWMQPNAPQETVIQRLERKGLEYEQINNNCWYIPSMDIMIFSKTGYADDQRITKGFNIYGYEQ